MKKYFFSLLAYCFVFVLSVTAYADSLPSPFKILPFPKSVRLLNQPGLLFGSLQQISIKGTMSAPVMGYQLSQLPAGYTNSGKSTLTIQLDPNLAAMPSYEGYIS